MATTNDLKNGMTLNLDGQLWNVIEFQHVKPGKGGAFVRTKMISKQTVGEAVDYLLENAAVVVAMHEGNPLFIEMPASVELVITYTEPGLQGDRSSGGTKPATVETGITIQVPLFIKQDEKVLVDTRTGAYLGRAN